MHLQHINSVDLKFIHHWFLCQVFWIAKIHNLTFNIIQTMFNLFNKLSQSAHNSCNTICLLHDLTPLRRHGRGLVKLKIHRDQQLRRNSRMSQEVGKCLQQYWVRIHQIGWYDPVILPISSILGTWTMSGHDLVHLRSQTTKSITLYKSVFSYVFFHFLGLELIKNNTLQL